MSREIPTSGRRGCADGVSRNNPSRKVCEILAAIPLPAIEGRFRAAFHCDRRKEFDMTRMMYTHMMAASLAVLSLCGSARGQGRISNSHRVEPFAGEWKTWTISSGQAYRV